MSYAMLSAVAERAMPKNAKAVALCLADMANKSRECWPTIAQICARTDLSRATVHRALTWLVDESEVVSRSIETHANGGFKNSTFRFSLDNLELLPLVKDEVKGKRRKRGSETYPGLTGAPPSSHGETTMSHGETSYKNQSYNQSVEPLEVLRTSTERFAPVIEIDFQKGTRVRYDIDDGPDVENPFAQKAAERVGRKERSVKLWNWSDVAKDFGAEASRFYPMVPGRTNTAAVASVLKRESIKSGLTPELAVAMTDAFFWDRRFIVDGVHIWKQYLTALPRLLARAQATLDTPRDQRQGTSDLEPVRDREDSYDPFAVQRAWLIKNGMEVPDDLGADYDEEMG